MECVIHDESVPIDSKLQTLSILALWHTILHWLSYFAAYQKSL